MPWPHTKTLDVSDKHRKIKIANRVYLPGTIFYGLTLPPSFKNLILAVNSIVKILAARHLHSRYRRCEHKVFITTL